ncbi:peroxiredoxin-like family protein [Kitasatospora arboriphila]|uniref:Peroxiredoxin-like family protein n=1 Tax=Kitasatospora arboriphila TaxID=258052 RepID=A0ABN1TJ96_9ACTN
MPRLQTGTTAPVRQFTDVTGAPAARPGPEGLLHLQFRRFAGCPICNLHLRSFAQRQAELAAAGVREAVVFHSPADELRPYADSLPFPLVADPDRQLYRAFGVERGARALLDPRVWPTVLRALARSVPLALRGKERPPAARPLGGRLGLPADFLIGPDGRLFAVHYGEHAADHWSADTVLGLAAPVRVAAGREAAGA